MLWDAWNIGTQSPVPCHEVTRASFIPGDAVTIWWNRVRAEELENLRSKTNPALAATGTTPLTPPPSPQSGVVGPIIES